MAHVHLKVAFLLVLSATATAYSQAVTAPLPAFEVATIKPCDPNAASQIVGFHSRPGGRIFVGCVTAKELVYYAFKVQEFQISGGPDWISADLYNIEAVPPDTAQSRTAVQPPIAVRPSSEQRQMLQSLLMDRFGLKCHTETREGAVYTLTRGSSKLLLEEPKDKNMDARSGVMMKSGGIVDGEAWGQNVSMALLASQLSALLNLAVVDQTGITGSYDFHLAANDPENRDYATAIFDAMHRLGLNLKRGTGQVDSLVIDHIERPTEN